MLNSLVVCKHVKTAKEFKLEVKDMYPYIKAQAQKFGWKYMRVETSDQDGFPDILLVRGSEYWFIEAKILKKKALVSLLDDLNWQFGQIGFMKRALTKRLRYILAVAKGKEIVYILGEYYEENSKLTDNADFIELI